MRVVYIDIDSLRTDHLSCYGYHRKTTPNIDRLAADGVRFTNFYATDTPCLPSRTALFSGRFGIHTGVVNHGGTNADIRIEGPGRGFRSVSTHHALAERLRMAGWYTASISPFPHRHSAYQIWEGFHETFDTGGNGNERAEVCYPYVERWLEHNKDRDNWFLHFNYWDPHTPYDTPLEYGEPFKDDPPPAWVTQAVIDKQRKSYSPHDIQRPHARYERTSNPWPRGAHEIKNPADFKQWIDGYDTGIHYADHYVGKVIQKLKALGIYEDTAILVSADHGENHGELEVWGDHQTADQITNNIPLVIRWPGLTDDKAGKAFHGKHYNIDLASTLVELFGGEQPECWDGRSFANTLKTGKDAGRDYLILSQCAWSCQRSARWDDWLLIRTYHTGHKNFPSLMLFNLKDDPHEQHNLAKSQPELVNHGLRLMDGWVAEQLGKSGHADPLHQVIAEGGPLHANRRNLGGFCEFLKNTGRAAHAEWLAKHDGAPRDDGGSNY
ncbi:MAG: sulfatase [Planctomycetota bacterium]|nr:sulfatase [Planctomycetota bacterium]